MTNLDEFLDTIHPERVFEELDRRRDEAFNTFPVPGARIDRWEDFQYCMTAFHRHMENDMLRLDPPLQADATMDWWRAKRLLQTAYGANGEKAAFECVRTGVESGLAGVLRRVAELMAREYAGNEIRARVQHFWDSLSVEERLAAADEYVATWGHLLPSELTEHGATRIKANFPRVLEQHPRLLGRLRQVR